MATAAGVVFHADDDALALGLQQAGVFGHRDLVDLGGQGGPGGFEVGQFLQVAAFPRGQLRELGIHVGLGRGGDLVGGGDHLLRGLDLLHQFELLVVQSADELLGLLDLVAVELILVVLLCLELLGGILVDLLL